MFRYIFKVFCISFILSFCFTIIPGGNACGQHWSQYLSYDSLHSALASYSDASYDYNPPIVTSISSVYLGYLAQPYPTYTTDMGSRRQGSYGYPSLLDMFNPPSISSSFYQGPTYWYGETGSFPILQQTKLDAFPFDYRYIADIGTRYGSGWDIVGLMDPYRALVAPRSSFGPVTTVGDAQSILDAIEVTMLREHSRLMDVLVEAQMDFPLGSLYWGNFRYSRIY